MEIALLLLLLSYSFCEELKPLYLPKYGSVTSTETNRLIYLPVEDFKDDSTIYIQLNVYNSYLYNTIIDYNFIDFVPNSTYEPLKQMKPSYSASSSSEGIFGNSLAEYYYYKFKKQSNMKYLAMKYWNYYYVGRSESYLEIENTRNKWIIALIIISVIIGLILIIGIISFCIIKYRRKKNESLIDNQADTLANQSKNQNVPGVKPENQSTPYDPQQQNAEPQSQSSPYDQQQQYAELQEVKPENKPTPYDQQQQNLGPQEQNNIYYEPPPISPINSSKNPSECMIEEAK